jgi:hypothetical protein
MRKTLAITLVSPFLLAVGAVPLASAAHGRDWEGRGESGGGTISNYQCANGLTTAGQSTSPILRKGTGLATGGLIPR